MEPEIRAACEEIVLDGGSEFTVCVKFFPASSSARLLALEALFRSLRDIPLTVSDPGVAVAKLGWWQSEISQALKDGTQHPVVLALEQSGALATLDEELIQQYLHGLALSLQDQRADTTDAFIASLQERTGLEGLIFASAASDDDSATCLRRAAARLRLSELIRSLARVQAQHDWLPLDLVARHSLGLEAESRSERLVAIASDLALAGTAWGGLTSDPIPVDSSSGRQFLIMAEALALRRFKRLEQKPQHIHSGRSPATPGDVLSTWRLARKISREAS